MPIVDAASEEEELVSETGRRKKNTSNAHTTSCALVEHRSEINCSR